MRWFLLAAVAALIWLLRAVPGPGWVDPSASVLLALGMIMIGGELVGDLAQRWRLPRVTGYLLLGMVLGPSVAGLVTRADLHGLVLFEELALGLIALTAGGELRVEALKNGWRSLVAITAGHAVGIFLASSALFWLILGPLPFLGALGPAERLAAVALLGTLTVAKSPATTIAIITETRSRGPLVDTVLGVTVVKDLLILLLFTWVSGMAAGWIGGGGVDLGVLGALGGEMVLSLVAGTLLGLALGVYLAHLGFHPEITVLAVVLVSMELAHTWRLEHLLMTMAAGFVARNVFPAAATGFLHALERSSPPIYVVFFALVGAGLDLGVFRTAWAGVAVLVVVRLALTWGLTAAPAALAGAPVAVRRWAWMGFVAQAG
ncbi:MAG TPA: hypothetical protein ENK19_02010, partial [Acidobacteria bacterium]|nr:hypothetical protein [Acidobacteriota bacterium]